MTSCKNCPAHRTHELRILDNKERIDKHDIEFNDVKTSFAAAMKFKVPRWVFISTVGGFCIIFSIQWSTLTKVSDKLNEIGTQVTVLYDRETREIAREKKATLQNNKEVKSCLILASNRPM